MMVVVEILLLLLLLRLLSILVVLVLLQLVWPLLLLLLSTLLRPKVLLMPLLLLQLIWLLVLMRAQMHHDCCLGLVAWSRMHDVRRERHGSSRRAEHGHLLRVHRSGPYGDSFLLREKGGHGHRRRRRRLGTLGFPPSLPR